MLEKDANLIAALHVMPVEDLRDHDAHPSCWCKPTNDEGVWIHHAMDRREEYEDGRKLS